MHIYKKNKFSNYRIPLKNCSSIFSYRNSKCTRCTNVYKLICIIFFVFYNSLKKFIKKIHKKILDPDITTNNVKWKSVIMTNNVIENLYLQINHKIYFKFRIREFWISCNFQLPFRLRPIRSRRIQKSWSPD